MNTFLGYHPNIALNLKWHTEGTSLYCRIGNTWWKVEYEYDSRVDPVSEDAVDDFTITAVAPTRRPVNAVYRFTESYNGINHWDDRLDEAGSLQEILHDRAEFVLEVLCRYVGFF